MCVCVYMCMCPSNREVHAHLLYHYVHTMMYLVREVCSFHFLVVLCVGDECFQRASQVMFVECLQCSVDMQRVVRLVS